MPFTVRVKGKGITWVWGPVRACPTGVCMPQSQSSHLTQHWYKSVLLKIQQAKEWMQGVMECSLPWDFSTEGTKDLFTDSAEQKSQALFAVLCLDSSSGTSTPPPPLLIAAHAGSQGENEKKIWRQQRRSVLHLRWKIELFFSEYWTLQLNCSVENAGNPA